MRFAMYALVIAGFAGLVVTMAIGLGWIPTEHKVAWHWQTAIWTVLLLLSAHTVVMFYFLATGKQLRVLMQESGRPVNREYLLALRAFKSKVFPPLMLAIGTTIATFVIGAGVLVGSVPRVVHFGLAIVALISNAVAAAREFSYIRRNTRLIAAIERDYLE
ncbi:MAG: hypothetical protein JSW67_01210 [Candidatus Latescibacterota bacterium]|nr:MAG: hypothetical protein JSW67_01210 [Candidatus Latescibacterota bacterium]